MCKQGRAAAVELACLTHFVLQQPNPTSAETKTTAKCVHKPLEPVDYLNCVQVTHWIHRVVHVHNLVILKRPDLFCRAEKGLSGKLAWEVGAGLCVSVCFGGRQRVGWWRAYFTRRTQHSFMHADNRVSVSRICIRTKIACRSHHV